MELNNQYYKYIYNTLPKNKQQQGDSDLKIGSVVKNLVPDLIEENLHNPNYTEFYGDITDYKDKKWYTTDQTETIKNGLLSTQVSLKGNKSYVLQVLNAVAPQSLDQPVYNSIQYGENKELVLDQYIYFKPLEDIKCTINCYGVGYSYVLYGTQNGSLCELRSFSVSEKSKVFLFESNMPWRVDDTGTIIDISETKLLYLGNSSINGIEVTLTTDDILNIFSEAPKMQIDEKNNMLFTYMPQSESNGTWKYKPIWEYIYKSPNKLEVMDNIYLIAYRNFLDVVERDYDNKQYPRQYGQIRTAQINKQSTRDTIRTQSGKINKIRYTALTLIDIQNNKKQLDSNSTITIKGSTTAPYLQLFSLLGYNYYYTNNKQFDDDLKYKYTSISFAWCVRINDKWSRISEFSEPIFIERNLCTSVGKDDKNQPIFGFEEYNITRKTSDYYPNESIYIEKKQPLI